ncbi:hypothetical protein K438DRAFT_2096607 [Mycena galopus ATCC 62051]|nr:hypothetical protein K438DRAFT_2096607 [Mycena galopus ATCC 62051]
MVPGRGKPTAAEGPADMDVDGDVDSTVTGNGSGAKAPDDRSRQGGDTVGGSKASGKQGATGLSKKNITVTHADGMHGGGLVMKRNEGRPGRMTGSTLKPIMKVEKEDADVEDELRSRMMQGSWRVHEGFGFCMCTKTMVKSTQGKAESDEESDSDSPSLSPLEDGEEIEKGAYGGGTGSRRWGVARDHGYTGLMGELTATERALEAALAEARGWTEQVGALRSDLVASNRSAQRNWDYSKELEKTIDGLREQLRIATNELEEERQRYDDSRHRKRAATGQHHPAGEGCNPAGEAGGGPRTARPTGNVEDHTISEDVTMAEAAVVPSGTTVPSWSDMPTLARRIVHEPTMTEFTAPPLGVSWKLSAAGEFSSLDAYSEALTFVHDHKCWGVGIALFRTYVDARKNRDNKVALSSIQSFALGRFRTPPWMWKEFTSCIKEDATAKNNVFWQNMSHPEPTQSIRAAAAYLQQRMAGPVGCPFLDEFNTLDARLVRGYLLWSAIGPPRRKAHTPAEMAHVVAVGRALLGIIMFPNTYTRILASEGITISPASAFQTWNTLENGVSADTNTVRRLAAMGVTVEQVDSMCAFGWQYLADLCAHPKYGWELEELTSMLTHVDEHAVAQNNGTGIPHTAPRQESDRIPRVLMVPWENAKLNAAQEKGPFLLNIPYGHIADESFLVVTLRPKTSTPVGPRTYGANSRGGAVGHGNGGVRGDTCTIANIPRGRGRGTFGIHGRSGFGGHVGAANAGTAPPRVEVANDAQQATLGTFAQTNITPQSSLFETSHQSHYPTPSSTFASHSVPSTGWDATLGYINPAALQSSLYSSTVSHGSSQQHAHHQSTATSLASSSSAPYGIHRSMHAPAFQSHAANSMSHSMPGPLYLFGSLDTTHLSHDFAHLPPHGQF